MQHLISSYCHGIIAAVCKEISEDRGDRYSTIGANYLLVLDFTMEIFVYVL